MKSLLRSGAVGFILLPLFCLTLWPVLKKGETFFPFSLKDVNEKIFTVTLEDGKLTMITEFLADGKTEKRKSYPDAVLLDFWATWCVPCRTAMPYMQKIHEAFQPGDGQEKGGLVLFGVALDMKGSKVVKPFYSKLKITYPMLADPTEGPEGDGIIRTSRHLAERYRVQEIPVVYLIDNKGCIVHAHVGFKKEEMGSLENRIKSLLQE
jgi:thiol-disulfide isomerase/thioredoxin